MAFRRSDVVWFSCLLGEIFDFLNSGTDFDSIEKNYAERLRTFCELISNVIDFATDINSEIIFVGFGGKRMKFYQIPKQDKWLQADFLLSATKIDALPLFAQRCEIFEDEDFFYLKSERLPTHKDFTFPPREFTTRGILWNVGPGAKPFADIIIEWKDGKDDLKAMFTKDVAGRLHLVLRERTMAEDVYYQFSIFGFVDGMPISDTVFIAKEDDWRNKASFYIFNVCKKAYPYVCRHNGETWIKEKKHVRWEKLDESNTEEFAKKISLLISQRFIKETEYGIKTNNTSEVR